MSFEALLRSDPSAAPGGAAAAERARRIQEANAALFRSARDAAEAGASTAVVGPAAGTGAWSSSSSASVSSSSSLMQSGGRVDVAALRERMERLSRACGVLEEDRAVRDARVGGRRLVLELDRLLAVLAREVARAGSDRAVAAVGTLQAEFARLKSRFEALDASGPPLTTPADPLEAEAAAARLVASAPGGVAVVPEQGERDYDERGAREFGAQFEQQAQAALVLEGTNVDVDEVIRAERQRELLALQRSVEEVAEIYRDLGELVNAQAPMLDSIEANIDAADGFVDDGVKELDKAHTHRNRGRAVALPVGGAILGAAIGGPVGLALGLKGGIIAVAAIGAVGGVGAGMGAAKLAKSK